MKKTLLACSIALAIGIAATAQTTILSEDFQATSGTAIPATWTQQTAATDGGWKTGIALGSQYWPVPDHTRYAATNDDDCNCDKALDRLKTPVLNFTGYTKIFMSVDIFFGGGTYQGATEDGKIEISTDGGSAFNVLQTLTGAADWNTVEVDLTSYAGQSNVVIAFNYNDGGGWLFGFAIDNVKIFEPAAIDAGATSVVMQDYVGVNVAQTLTGKLKNYGSSAITSLDLNYAVNGGAPVTQALSGLNIAALTSYNYSHSTAWTPTATGTYTLKVWTSNINGGTDANAANDTASKTVVVVAQVVPRVCLFEQFTSSTCAPCAAEAPAVNALLDANNTNNTGSSMAAVKYQMNWPSPGNDPSYNAHGNTRKTFYGVSGIPFFAIDGIESNDDQQSIDAATAIPSIMSVDVSYTVSGNTVNVTANVLPYASISATTKLHIAVIEKYYNYPGAATSQKDYYFITRKMLPSGSGTTISPLTEGVIKTVTQTSTFTVTTPPAQNSFDLWVGMSNIEVVAWVQDNAGKKIYQTAFAAAPGASSPTATATSVNTTFGQCNGTATANALGGTSPYTYAWSTTPAQTTQTATGLCAGSYSVTVTDSVGGTATATVTLSQGAALAANATLVSNTSNDVNCNGSATVAASGGTPPYTYAWSTTTPQTTQTATGLCAGEYGVTVTDNVGGTFVDSVTVTSTVGIKDASVRDEIQVFPNPSNGIVYVSANSAQTVEISLVNVLGEKVYSGKKNILGKAKTTVDLSALSEGMYFIIIKNGSGNSTTRKLVLEK